MTPLMLSLLTPVAILIFFFYWAYQAPTPNDKFQIRCFGVGIALLVFVLHWIGVWVFSLFGYVYG